MRPIATFLIALITLGLTACKDETISGFADRDTEWVLRDLNRKPFPARATIAFPDQGSIKGQAPCNRYASEQKAPYPWFEIGPIVATKIACENLDAEKTFFEALRQMRMAEVSGGVLILSNEAGQQMVFVAAPKP